VVERGSILKAVTMSGAVFFAAACTSICQNTVVCEALSPDGQLKAIVFHRNCGATTGCNSMVSILPATASLPDAAGNVLNEDQGRSDTVSLGVSVTWKNNDCILVRHDQHARIIAQHASVDVASGSFKSRSVRIEYGELLPKNTAQSAR
jgi:hypothetical protein